MYHEAVHAIHGPLLYVTGAGGYDVPKWFEKELGIEPGEELLEGFNVINFSLSLAKALGCNPIIFVGVDLAYSNNRSYSSGIVNHAIHDPKLDFRTKNSSEELVLKNDVNGEPVYTLWKWLTESAYFSVFAQDNSQLLIYNCTEGGIGFRGIPNATLKSISELLLQKQYDLNGWIHAELQKASMPLGLTTEKVVEKIEELSNSFKKSSEHISAILNDYGKMLTDVNLGKAFPPI